MSAPPLDQETLKRLLTYDPNTGAFTWRHRENGRGPWNRRYAGKLAGYDWTPPPGTVTYRCIRVFDWPFLAHRLAWLYMTGEWPKVVVDHKDRDGTNNRWSNLRAATRPQNMANTGAFRTNALGLRGVSLHKSSGRYRATIKVAGRQRFLGHYDTPEEAHAAYLKAASDRYGEFARMP